VHRCRYGRGTDGARARSPIRHRQTPIAKMNEAEAERLFVGYPFG
jgi:hypothetical protein